MSHDLEEKVEHIDNKVDQLTRETSNINLLMTRLVNEVIPEQKQLREMISSQQVEIGNLKIRMHNMEQKNQTQTKLYLSVVVTVIGMGLGFLFGGG